MDNRQSDGGLPPATPTSKLATRNALTRLNRTLTLLTCAWIVACGADDRQPPVVRLDYVGEIPSGPLDQDTALLIPSDIHVFADGSILVADNAGPTLRFLDSSGRIVRVIGRRGAGPGEFRSLEAIAVSGVTNEIAAADSRNRRVTVLNTSGDVLQQLPIESGRVGSITFDANGDLHLDQRGSVTSTRSPGTPTVLVFATSGERKYGYGSYEPGDEPLGDPLLNESRFAAASDGTWVLLPYQGKARFYAIGKTTPGDSIVLPPPIGRAPDGPFAMQIEGLGGGMAIVREPVADDIAVSSTGLVFIAARQSLTDEGTQTDVLVYRQGAHVGTIRLHAFSYRIVISENHLFALRNPYADNEPRIDVYRIVIDGS